MVSPPPNRSRANVEYIGQTRPDYVFGVKVKVLKMFILFSLPSETDPNSAVVSARAGCVHTWWEHTPTHPNSPRVSIVNPPLRNSRDGSKIEILDLEVIARQHCA